jgi:hypothetical protein
MDRAHVPGVARHVARLRDVSALPTDSRCLFSSRRGLFAYVGLAGATARYAPVGNVVCARMLCGRHPGAVGKVSNLSDDSTWTWLRRED